MSDPKKQWFKEFESYFRDSTGRAGSYFIGHGSERLRAYRIISELEQLTARLWRIVRAQEEEDLLGRRSQEDMV